MEAVSRRENASSYAQSSCEKTKASRIILSGGAYTAVLAKGDSQEKAFGYAYAVIAAAALKAGLVNAGEVGMGKAPFFVWGAIASYIAYKALDE